MPSEAFKGQNSDEKSRKIAELRAAVSAAEKQEDEERVLLFEAELRAVEAGQDFDRDAFLLAQLRKKGGAKKKKLQEIRDIPPFVNNDRVDIWPLDGVPARKLNEDGSYERTFGGILDELGYEDFQGLVEARAKELGRDVAVLDLFGGAYFLPDLKSVSRIVGVRLVDIDESLRQKYSELEEENRHVSEVFENIINNPKRSIIEGDLYTGKTWRQISKTLEQEELPGFDLIVCRPQGPFGYSHSKMWEYSIRRAHDEGLALEEIFVVLLRRALKLLSKDGGMLFTQEPILSTDPVIKNKFWEKLIKEQEDAGYKFIHEGSREFAFQRTK